MHLKELRRFYAVGGNKQQSQAESFSSVVFSGCLPRWHVMFSATRQKLYAKHWGILSTMVYGFSGQKKRIIYLDFFYVDCRGYTLMKLSILCSVCVVFVRQTNFCVHRH